MASLILFLCLFFEEFFCLGCFCFYFRYNVAKYGSIVRDLRPEDFDPNEKFWTRFPPEGSKITPPHQSVDFRWKDYCPMVFRCVDNILCQSPGIDFFFLFMFFISESGKISCVYCTNYAYYLGGYLFVGWLGI